jgi:hypothetical protein
MLIVLSYLKRDKRLLGLFWGVKIHMGKTLGREIENEEVDNSMSEWPTKRHM